MKNFEKYIDKIITDSNESVSCAVYAIMNNLLTSEGCIGNCESCEDKVKKWLLQDCKEPYKLSRLEYEILKDIKKRGTNAIEKARNGRDLYALYAGSRKMVFSCFSSFLFLENGVEYKINDIFSNCEVLDNAD